MKRLQRYIISGLTIGLTLWPNLAAAQLRMQSGSYLLSDINFGSDVSLSITQDSIPPEIGSQGVTITELEPRKATLEWTTNKRSSSSVVYGTSTSYGFENGTATQSIKHKVTLFGLDPETTYHYKVISTDPFGASGESEDKTFTTPADLGINTIKVSDVGYDRALISWKTGNLTVSKVEYGESQSYGSSKSTSSNSLSADHTVQLTDLEEGTEYHFRIAAENERGVTLRSSDQTFTTIAEPKFVSVDSRLINPNEVEVRWQTNTPTSGILTYKAASGPATATQTAGSSSLQTRHSATLKSLVGDVDYNFSIVATDEQGKQVNSGSRSFRTPVDKEPPVVSDLKVQVTRSGDELVLRVNYKTNEPARSNVVYGPKTSVNDAVDLPGPSGFATEHTLVATGLKPSTPYGLTGFAVDPAGNRASSEISFVTPKFNKTIFQLIADIFVSRFGFLSNIVSR